MFCSITTTTNKKQIIDKLSKRLLEEKYSPCIQVTAPIESKYSWEGKIKTTKEYKIDIKTLDSLSDDVVTLIKSIHNYEIPEIIKQSISVKDKDYKEWMLKNIKK